MKILITNHHLGGIAGTEIFTYTIANALRKREHDVFVYSPYLGEFSKIFGKSDIPTVSNLGKLDNNFDIAHVHHNVIAYEVRNRYPKLPIIFISHGVIPFLEKPPPTDIGITKFMAVGEEVRDMLINSGISQSKIGIFRNPVNEKIFFSKNPINVKPKKALVISNYIDHDTENVVRQACSKLSIDLRFVGARFEIIPNDQMPNIIRDVDLVFTLSRGSIESMFCGRIPIIIDRWGGDGMVTPENFSALIRDNFSGRYHQYKYTESELCAEIKKYQQGYGEELRQMAMDEFSVANQTDKLIKIYHDCLNAEVVELAEKDKKIIDFLCTSIRRTRHYSQKRAKKEFISEIGGYRAYKLCKALGKLRKLINI